MRVILTPDRAAMGRWVATAAAADLRRVIESNGAANLVVATGSSQFEVLAELAQQPDIDWSCVHGFHLDEYVGIGVDHPASFCKYLRERFVQHVPIASFEYLRGDQDVSQTIARATDRLREQPIDLALVGIGENGHLAFNDPPADFETREAYLVVELDEPCRQQQVGEGWFDSLSEVPTHAISMSVHQILKSEKIYCSVPDQRKAAAVRATLEDEISPQVPASILRRHPAATLIIDDAAANELGPATRQRVETV